MAKVEPEEYLKKHHIMTYIQDLTYLVIENRTSKGLSKTHPIAFIQEYFQNLIKGVHVHQRDYSFISATPYNRACFIRMIWQCYHKGFSTTSKLLTAEEFHQLLQLLCSDFSEKFTDKIHALVVCRLPDASTEQNKIAFCDFLYTFQVLFYYEDFICDCEKFAVDGGNTETTDHPVKGVVVLPRLPHAPTAEDTPKETVSAHLSPVTKFTDSVKKLCNIFPGKHSDQSCPSITAIDSVLETFITSTTEEDSDQLLFNKFLTHLCNTEVINLEIGILPPKQHFHEVAPPVLGY